MSIHWLSENSKRALIQEAHSGSRRVVQDTKRSKTPTQEHLPTTSIEWRLSNSKKKKKRKKAKSRAKNKSLQPEQVRDLSTRWMEDLLGLALTAPWIITVPYLLSTPAFEQMIIVCSVLKLPMQGFTCEGFLPALLSSGAFIQKLATRGGRGGRSLPVSLSWWAHGINKQLAQPELQSIAKGPADTAHLLNHRFPDKSMATQTRF